MVAETVRVARRQFDEEAAEEVKGIQFRDVASEMVIVSVRGNLSPCSTRQLREGLLGHILLLAAEVAAWSWLSEE
jgi:hypothetical protein